jgi:hypothetical protein
LAGHPPFPDRLGFGRVGEVEDHDNVAGVAVLLRRDVDVALNPNRSGASRPICNARSGAASSGRRCRRS